MSNLWLVIWLVTNVLSEEILSGEVTTEKLERAMEHLLNVQSKILKITLIASTTPALTQETLNQIGDIVRSLHNEQTKLIDFLTVNKLL